MTSTAQRRSSGTVGQVEVDQLHPGPAVPDAAVPDAPTADPPGWAESFDARTVPCVPATMPHVRDMLLLHSAHRSPQAVAFLADLAAQLSTLAPDGAHRALLDAQRRMRRTHPSLQPHLTAALDAVRRHSTLYTARTCHCLAQAWADWQRSAQARLATVAAESAMWATERDGVVVPDMQAPLQVADLLTRSAAGWRAPRTPVQLQWDPTGRLTFTANRRTYVLHRPTREQRSLAQLVRFSTVERRSTVAAWVRSWPAELGPVLTALTTRPGRAAQAAADAADLIAAGIRHLDARGLGIAVALAGEWAGPASELPAAVLAVSAPPGGPFS